MGAAGKARVERTRNTYCMFVTLDVSKLSGWLNADADCRVERRACDAGRGAGPGCGRQGVGRGRRKQRAEGRGSVQNLGRQGRRGAHPEHPEHVRDAGRAEAQRLVESRGALPSRKEGMRRGARRRAGRRHAGAAAAQAARARGRLRLKAGGQGTRGAHVKHGGHVRDAGRVKAQRLVER